MHAVVIVTYRNCVSAASRKEMHRVAEEQRRQEEIRQQRAELQRLEELKQDEERQHALHQQELRDMEHAETLRNQAKREVETSQHVEGPQQTDGFSQEELEDGKLEEKKENEEEEKGEKEERDDKEDKEEEEEEEETQRNMLPVPLEQSEGYTVHQQHERILLRQQFELSGQEVPCQPEEVLQADSESKSGEWLPQECATKSEEEQPRYLNLAQEIEDQHGALHRPDRPQPMDCQLDSQVFEAKVIEQPQQQHGKRMMMHAPAQEARVSCSASHSDVLRSFLHFGSRNRSVQTPPCFARNRSLVVVKYWSCREWPCMALSQSEWSRR